MAAVLASSLSRNYLATSSLNEVASVFLGEPMANCYDADGISHLHDVVVQLMVWIAAASSNRNARRNAGWY